MAEKFDNPNYNPEAGMKYLATHFDMFKPEVAKAMIADAKRKGVKIPPVVEAKARKAGILNSVRNARDGFGAEIKVGDIAKFITGTWRGLEGTVVKIEGDKATVRTKKHGNVVEDLKLVRVYNSVRNAKYVKGVKVVSPKGNVRGEIVGVRAIYQHGLKDEVFDVLLESGPRKGEVMRSQRESEWEVVNSVRNARLKVGDRVKVTWYPDGQEKGIVGKTGELLRLSSEGTALVDIDGHEYFTDKAYLKLANSVRNAKFKVGDEVVFKANGHRGEVKKIDGGKIGVRWAFSSSVEWHNEDELQRSANSVRSTNAVVAKAMAMNAVRRKPIKKGRYSGESGDMTYYVDYTADKWFAKKYGKDGTNVTEIKIMGPYEKDSNGRDVKHILYLFAQGHESIKAKDQQTRSLVEAIMRGPNVVKQGDESFAWNSQEAESVDGVSRNASDPYLGEELKLMIAHGAISVSAGGKPSVGDVVFEHRGKKYYVGKDSAHMVKQFADAGLVKMVNSKQKNEPEIIQIEKAIGRELTDEEFWIVGDRILGSGPYGIGREVKAIISELKAGKLRKSRSKNHVHNSVVAKALNAVRVARNGNVVLRTVSGGTARVYEGGKVLYGGREYVAKAIGSPHMDKATLVDGAGNKIVVSLKDVDLKALSAVRNAWADAPDAATAKRDIEQTVRKATEIAKRRYGAPKATYKMTPNDSLWCGYIDLTFNTEEEAKKCNPYYLFDELGDNKSILPKWSWAIGGFNYQKTGKVVRIFIGTLNT